MSAVAAAPKAPPVERLKKTVPVPYTKYLPEGIVKNLGHWADRKFHGSGIIEHISDSGYHLFTVKTAAPSNIRFSTETLREFTEIADKIGNRSIRVTRSGSVEFFAESLDQAHAIQKALEGMGYAVGGWGNTLWSIQSCTAYLTCTTAVVDSPSVVQVLYNKLKPYFTGEVSLPAKLRINVGGCPTSCGGLVSDIVLTGHYGAAPDFDYNRVRLCLPMRAEILSKVTPEVQMVCPVNAIRSFAKDDGTVGIEIIQKKCIGCGRCKDVCDHVTWDPEKIGVSVLIGGKGSNAGIGPTLARVLIPWIPATAPDYRETVAVVQKIIDVWRENAKPGERIGDWTHRVGMKAVFDLLKVPVGRWNRPSDLATGFGVRQFLSR